MPKSRYTLVTYLVAERWVVSAIHAYDIASFLREHPEAMLVKK